MVKNNTSPDAALIHIITFHPVSQVNADDFINIMLLFFILTCTACRIFSRNNFYLRSYSVTAGHLLQYSD